jgi:anti-sigma B factor antagonist
VPPVGQEAGTQGRIPAVHDDTTPSTVQLLAVPELVTLPAEIDISNASEVREIIGAAFGPLVTVVVADMTKSVFCDSTGARELLLASMRAEESHAVLRLVIGDSPVLRILTILGFDCLLRIYPTMSAALTGSPVNDSRSG